jgi:exoribonuclease-2
MHFIFEEGGEIKAATAIGQAAPNVDTWQAQTQFGKRIKLKAKDVWLKWEGEDTHRVMEEARALVPSIDIDFLWECSPIEEFAFDQIAKEYSGEKVKTEQL